MEILFMKGLLDKISQGDFLKGVFATFLRIIGGLLTLLAVIMWFYSWYMIFRSGSFRIIIGGIIMQAFVAVAFYMVIHTIFIRAGDIQAIPMGEFTVIPMVSLFMRLEGEVMASFIFMMSLGGGIAMWFAGRIPIPMSMPMRVGGGFLGGLSMIIFGFVAAVFILFFFYLMAESIVVLVNIATNIGLIKQKLNEKHPA